MSQLLDLVWTATFADGHVIRQFDNERDQTGEHLFRELQEYPARLVLFQLEHLTSRRVYQVDLVHGRFTFRSGQSPCSSPEAEVVGDTLNDYRLIYFRRVIQEMSWGGSDVSANGCTVLYFLGFQWTNEDGRRIIRLAQISKDDEVYLV